MNCQELNAFLDTLAPTDRSAAQRQDVERHLASCPACRASWAAFDEVAAAPIPKTPPALQRRIAAALEAEENGEPQRVVRRSIVLGSLLFAGAAVATTLTLGLQPRERAVTGT